MMIDQGRIHKAEKGQHRYVVSTIQLKMEVLLTYKL